MVAAAVQFYDVVLFVHLSAIVVAFGPTFAYPVFLAVAERTDPRAIAAVGRGIQAWDRILGGLLVVVIASGVYLVIDGPWSFGDFYVSWGIAAVLVLAALAGAYFTPKTRRLVEIAERDMEAAAASEAKLSDEFRALNAQIARVGALTGLIILLTIYVMTAKPFQ